MAGGPSLRGHWEGGLCHEGTLWHCLGGVLQWVGTGVLGVSLLCGPWGSPGWGSPQRRERWVRS